MDYTLLGVGLGLIVVGFVVGLIGLFVQQREKGGRGEPLPSLTDLVIKALLELFTAIPKVVTGTVGERIQGLGSVFAWAGGLAIAVWAIRAIQPATQSNPPTTSPS